MQIEFFGISDRGLHRDHNEDSFLTNEEEGLYLVADGMGGLSKGEVASSIAVDSVNIFIKDSREKNMTLPLGPKEGYSVEENRLMAAIWKANWDIFAEFQKDESNNVGMGTTLVGLLQDENRFVTANVGDSRIYRFRGDELKQLSEDHSVVMEAVKRGDITPEEARTHPHKHIINRALGVYDTVDVDIVTYEVAVGDVYLLCSDGLSDMITDEEILMAYHPNRDGSLENIAGKMVEAAINAGGRDNITVLLVAVID